MLYEVITGCAALLADSVNEVKNVYHLELGMPEAFWELSVENFGPLIVAMDAQGNSLYSKVNENVDKNLENIIKKL